MKIIFICGGVEPGRDGVGDYAMLLASRLVYAGHEAFIIGINDSYIKEDIQQSNLINGGAVLNILRIASNKTEGERFAIASEFIKTINPDLISLQFVPYSFNKKGLPYTFGQHLKALREYKWHIMFHELWLDKPEKTSQYIVEFLQRRIIKRLVNILKPKAVNVSITHNKRRLKSIGVNAEILGLFGNILKSDLNYLPAGFETATENSIKILYFGGAPRGQYLTQVVNGLNKFCNAASTQISFVIISGNTQNKKDFIAKLTTDLPSDRFNILSYSDLDTDVVSAIISNCNIGVARSEPNMLGKSGSAIAMLEHGLPLWLPKWQEGEKLEYSFRSQLVFSDLTRAVNELQKEPKQYHSLLQQSVEQFSNQFK